MSENKRHKTFSRI